MATRISGGAENKSLKLVKVEAKNVDNENLSNIERKTLQMADTLKKYPRTSRR